MQYLFSCMQIVAVALALGSAFVAVPVPSISAGDVAGVWSAANRDVQLSGFLTVTADEAVLGPSRAVLVAKPGPARLYRFPAGHGELRVYGWGSKRPIAFAIERSAMTGSTYAVWVPLRQLARDAWCGEVRPVADQMDLTLYVGRGDAGTTAFLRDPSYNLGRALGEMAVTTVGTTVKFAGAKEQIIGIQTDANTLQLTLPKDLELPTLTFIRRPTDDAASESAYHEPLPTGDGWPLGRASDVGFSLAKLEALARYARAAPSSVTSPDLHSIVIARRGRLVVDEYFDGFFAAEPHDMRSAGKTYADVLAGAAMQAGVSLRDDTQILPLFAEYGTLAHPDPRKSRITLGDALSMATGLDCDDNDDHSVANEDAVQNQTAQPDWYRLLLGAPIVRDPGTKAVYCSASINLAGGAIAASASHAWLPVFFAEHVAEPLQMQDYALNLTPTGQWYLGGGAYVRPRDFLKIGQLFLDGGRWHGRQIVPRAWIARSWSPRLMLSADDGYGYAWHIRSYTVGQVAYRAYEAQGNGGQILDVLPELDLVIMMTAGNYNNYKTWGHTRDAVVTRVIEALRA